MFTKGNRNVINIISAIAASGVAIGSLAMIIVLSAFNGLETLVADLYTTVDPDIRIAPERGKTISMDSIDYASIQNMDEISSLSPVLEETVFLQYDKQQTVATLRGIEQSYLPNLGLEEYVIEGQLALSSREANGSIIGYGIADNLNLFIRDGLESIKIYSATRGAERAMSPTSKFTMKRIMATGIVGLNPEFDFKYIYVPFKYAEDLLAYERKSSFIDITLAEGASESDVKSSLEQLVGPGYSVKTRLELNDIIFKTNATEKWITFFILSFILVVATFNLIGSLTMLIIEKRKDISLLRSIGQTVNDVRRVFLYEGILITGLGALLGLGFGIIIILLQQCVGFFPLQGGLVEYYPVELHLMDIVAVVSVVFGIGLLASLLPVKVLLTRDRLQTVISS